MKNENHFKFQQSNNNDNSNNPMKNDVVCSRSGWHIETGEARSVIQFGPTMSIYIYI